MWLWTRAVRRLDEDAEELFGTVDYAEACSRYDCGTIAQMTLSKGANVHYTDVQCIAAFDKDGEMFVAIGGTTRPALVCEDEAPAGEERRLLGEQCFGSADAAA